MLSLLAQLWPPLGVGPLGGDVGLVLAMQDLVGQWKLDLGVTELLDGWQ